MNCVLTKCVLPCYNHHGWLGLKTETISLSISLWPGESITQGLSWAAVAEQVGTRSEKQCRTKWLNYLNWKQQGGADWTRQDDFSLIEKWVVVVAFPQRHTPGVTQHSVGWEDCTRDLFLIFLKFNNYYCRATWAGTHHFRGFVSAMPMVAVQVVITCPVGPCFGKLERGCSQPDHFQSEVWAAQRNAFCWLLLCFGKDIVWWRIGSKSWGCWGVCGLLCRAHCRFCCGALRQVLRFLPLSLFQCYWKRLAQMMLKWLFIMCANSHPVLVSPNASQLCHYFCGVSFP